MAMVFVPDDMAQQIQGQVQQRMQMAGMMAPQMQRQQPMMQMQQTQQTPQMNGPDWIRVANMAQVEQVSVEPGQTRWILVQSDPVFATRTADNIGLIQTKYYKFEEIDPAAMQAATQPQTGVTEEAYKALLGRVAAIEKEINEAKERGAITASRKREAS